jgi:hypothetical protein
MPAAGRFESTHSLGNHVGDQMRQLPSRLASFTIVAIASAALALAAGTAAAQEGAPRPMASVPGGPVGSEVFVSMTGGLVPGRQVTLNFGGLTAYELVGRIDVAADGLLAATVKVPEWAERNSVYYFFLNMSGTRVFSDPFIVTGPAGEVSLTGTVSQVVGSCVVMAGDDRTSFSLAGIAGELPAVGARVIVDGVLGIRPGGAGGAFPCLSHPGIPVRVTSIKRPSPSILER